MSILQSFSSVETESRKQGSIKGSHSTTPLLPKKSSPSITETIQAASLVTNKLRSRTVNAASTRKNWIRSIQTPERSSQDNSLSLFSRSLPKLSKANSRSTIDTLIDNSISPLLATNSQTMKAPPINVSGFQPSQGVTGTYKSSGERIVIISLTEKGKPIFTTSSTVFQTASQGFRLSATLTITRKTGSVTGDSKNYSWSASNNKTEYLSYIDNSFSQSAFQNSVVQTRSARIDQISPSVPLIHSNRQVSSLSKQSEILNAIGRRSPPILNSVTTSSPKSRIHPTEELTLLKNSETVNFEKERQVLLSSRDDDWLVETSRFKLLFSTRQAPEKQQIHSSSLSANWDSEDRFHSRVTSSHATSSGSSTSPLKILAPGVTIDLLSPFGLSATIKPSVSHFQTSTSTILTRTAPPPFRATSISTAVETVELLNSSAKSENLRFTNLITKMTVKISGSQVGRMSRPFSQKEESESCKVRVTIDHESLTSTMINTLSLDKTANSSMHELLTRSPFLSSPMIDGHSAEMFSRRSPLPVGWKSMKLETISTLVRFYSIPLLTSVGFPNASFSLRWDVRVTRTLPSEGRTKTIDFHSILPGSLQSGESHSLSPFVTKSTAPSTISSPPAKRSPSFHSRRDDGAAFSSSSFESQFSREGISAQMTPRYKTSPATKRKRLRTPSSSLYNGTANTLNSSVMMQSIASNGEIRTSQMISRLTKFVRYSEESRGRKSNYALSNPSYKTAFLATESNGGFLHSRQASTNSVFSMTAILRTEVSTSSLFSYMTVTRNSIVTRSSNETLRVQGGTSSPHSKNHSSAASKGIQSSFNAYHSSMLQVTDRKSVV